MVGACQSLNLLESGIITEIIFQEIITNIECELNQNPQRARNNRSEIINVAKTLGMTPEPTGNGTNSRRANCPGTTHLLYLSTKDNTFGYGWCKRKGGPDELRTFVKERCSKK